MLKGRSFTGVSGAAGLLCIALLATTVNPARAEVSEVKIAMQYGLGHLPVMLMKQKKLVEKRLQEQGLPNTTTKYFQLAGSAAMNDALLSSSVDFTSGGLTGIATLWAASKGKVKAASAVNAFPMYLNTINPNIKSLKDFTPSDKIALPAVRVSPQAIVLEMAAQKELGDATKLDSLTVTMNHPDAMTALLSKSGAVNSHLGFSPYQEAELKHPEVHRVFSSYDVMGGPATIVVLGTRQDFYDQNPKTYKAVVQAMQDAIAYIKKDPEGAAKFYVEESGDKSSTYEEVLSLLKSPEIIFSNVPLGTMKFVSFMYERGLIKQKPESWKDLYFPNAYDIPGGS
jgi:NitT/TauT family transport system substrate-binding protein